MTANSWTDDLSETAQPLSALDTKTQDILGRLAIDKRRLPIRQLQKRGVPAYVGEWLLDTIRQQRPACA